MKYGIGDDCGYVSGRGRKIMIWDWSVIDEWAEERIGEKILKQAVPSGRALIVFFKISSNLFQFAAIVSDGKYSFSPLFSLGDDPLVLFLT